ncbi:MAG: NADP-dependent isocitrate dehydrogenase [Gammaproteobacteria bacterium]
MNQSEAKYVSPMGIKTAVTLCRGDGIGPEIMDATLAVLQAAGAALEFEEIEAGEKVYLEGIHSGMRPQAWDSLRRTRVLLKAPITTPQGGGYKSLNVTIRKTLGLYANVRPVTALAPFVPTRHPGIDLVIVRENEEDLYAGIEHRQTDQVFQCLKLITRPGCERIVRYAFEYARANGRKRVTCMTKDNIMKMTDGLFRRVFEEIGEEYPDIAQDHMIIDIGAARLADSPERFDVIVTPNLYGDILSDIAAQVAGSVGVAGSANVGARIAMFEAIHGSAPDIAGKGIANPSGLLQAAVMMLVHVGQPQVAALIANAWRCALEDGVHTADIAGGHTARRVGTGEFAQAVIDRLGKLPQQLPVVSFGDAAEAATALGSAAGADAAPRNLHAGVDAAAGAGAGARPGPKRARPGKALVGVDVFVDAVCEPDELASRLLPAAGEDFTLQMITNRGVKVWPGGMPETNCTDHWRCRFLGKGRHATHAGVIGLMSRLQAAGIDFIKTEHLCDFDGVPGFAAGHGQ